eukprot:TRINITY_DN2636_c0_g1_i3.p1 TRINITY_DN2636_c0_g1~~TRINITY_DN2636_c0_g1_i3.p1  ORF type:complete len:135 (-),score=3.50 TRINITY_DN2636_c0_g1_i3:220-624(-)
MHVADRLVEQDPWSVKQRASGGNLPPRCRDNIRQVSALHCGPDTLQPVCEAETASGGNLLYHIFRQQRVFINSTESSTRFKLNNSSCPLLVEDAISTFSALDDITRLQLIICTTISTNIRHWLRRRGRHCMVHG